MSVGEWTRAVTFFIYNGTIDAINWEPTSTAAYFLAKCSSSKKYVKGWQDAEIVPSRYYPRELKFHRIARFVDTGRGVAENSDEKTS